MKVIMGQVCRPNVLPSTVQYDLASLHLQLIEHYPQLSLSLCTVKVLAVFLSLQPRGLS